MIMIMKVWMWDSPWTAQELSVISALLSGLAQREAIQKPSTRVSFVVSGSLNIRRS